MVQFYFSSHRGLRITLTLGLYHPMMEMSSRLRITVLYGCDALTLSQEYTTEYKMWCNRMMRKN